jgi:hypothetical protein
VTRYKLPEVYGGGEVMECDFTDIAVPDGYAAVAPASPKDGDPIALIPRKWLTEVKPPMVEPPVGSVMRDRHGDAWVRMEGGWKCGILPVSLVTFEALQNFGPLTLLVPDPFAEPVELPFIEHGLKVQPTKPDAEFVYVDITGSRHGITHLTSRQARRFAAAIVAAADAVDAARERAS